MAQKMFEWVYTSAIIIFLLIVRLFSVVNSKARPWLKGRKDMWEPLIQWKGTLKNNPVIWIHCASLGEYEQSVPLHQHIRKRWPESALLFTFFSPSGFENVRPVSERDHSSYLPPDLPSQLHRFLDVVKPGMVLIIRKEFWYNMLKICHERNISIYSINSIFRKGEPLLYPFIRHMFSTISLFFVQDETSATILKQYGISPIFAMGDTRAERVLELKKEPWDHALQNTISPDQRCFVYGSIHMSDIPAILPFIKNNLQDVHLIFPHDVSLGNVHAISENLKVPHYLLSQGINAHVNICLADSTGILNKTYGLADVAYIGGGFGKGIHNITEALVYGTPVVIGPECKKFPEAVESARLGYITIVYNDRSFTESIEHMYHMKSKLAKPIIEFIEQRASRSSLIINKIADHHAATHI